MKDALTTIRERISTNVFDPDKKVSESEIQAIIADAIEAPSSYNIQHWRFVAVTDPEKKQQLKAAAYNQPKVGQAAATIIVLGDLRGHEKMAEIVERSVKQGHVPRESAAAVVQRATSAYEANPQFARDEAIRSGSMAGMTLMIAAQARGYATGPMIGFDPEAVKKIFKISDRYVPVMLITLGHAAPGNHPRKPRLGVHEVLAFNEGREF
jgi:nitroreductase